MKWFLSITATAVMFVLVLTLRSTARALTEQQAQNRASIGNLQRQMRELSDRADPLPPALRTLLAASQRVAAEAAPTPRSSNTSVVADAEPSATGAPAPETPESEKARIQDYVNTLDAAFANETIDRDWDHGAELEADSALRAALPRGSGLSGVTCRQTLCRGEVRHASVEQHRELLGKLAESLHWPGPSAILLREGPGQQTTTLAYFGRPGSVFPALEPVP